jgi:hypothetical protein
MDVMNFYYASSHLASAALVPVLPQAWPMRRANTLEGMSVNWFPRAQP